MELRWVSSQLHIKFLDNLSWCGVELNMMHSIAYVSLSPRLSLLLPTVII